MIPLWIRRLPHNLSTVRIAIRPKFNRLYWALGIFLYFHANKGDEDYLFHFEETGLMILFARSACSSGSSTRQRKMRGYPDPGG